MKKLVLIGIAVMLGSTAMAEEVDRTLDADSDGRIFVSNLSGSVEVVGWDRNEVRVTGTIGSDVEEFIFERSDETTKIKIKVPDRSWGSKDVSSELVISVPRGSSLHISTVSADIDIEEVEGEQTLQSVSGDITTEAFVEDIQAETVSGDVDIDGEGGSAEWDLTTVSGDITAQGVSGEIDCEVVSGDIEVGNGAFDRAELESVNGDILYEAGLRSGGKLEAESVNGSVDVEFDGPVSAKFEIETFNGGIDNCFGPEAQRTSRYAPGWELEFTEGDGDGKVSIATLNGRVTICK